VHLVYIKQQQVRFCTVDLNLSPYQRTARSAEDSKPADVAAVATPPLKHTGGYAPSTATPYMSVQPQFEVGPLKHVVVISRHGDRSIIASSLGGSGGWSSTKDTATMAAWANVIKAAPTVAPHMKEAERMSPATSAGVQPTEDSKRGDWPRGQLTGVGSLQLKRLGEWLRAAYAGQHDELLPLRLASQEQVNATLAARSTNFTRNLHSMQALLYGLYPPETRADDVVTPILVRNGNDETWYPLAGGRCDALLRAFRFGTHIAAAATDASAHPWDKQAALAARQIVQRHLGLEPADAEAFISSMQRCACAQGATADLVGYPPGHPARTWWQKSAQRAEGVAPLVEPTSKSTWNDDAVPDPVGAPAVRHMFNSSVQEVAAASEIAASRHKPSSAEMDLSNTGNRSKAGQESTAASTGRVAVPSLSFFPWYAVRDTLFCGYSHGVFPHFPGGQAHTDLYNTMNDCAARQFHSLYAVRQAVRFGAGRAIAEVQHVLNAAAGSPLPDAASQARPFALQGSSRGAKPAAVGHKMSVFLAHDSTIEPFLQAFRAVEGTTWPPYASTVIFELYAPAKAGEGHQVRVMSNGQPLPLKQLIQRERSLQGVRRKAARAAAAGTDLGSAADVYTAGDLPAVRPAGGWTHGQVVTDADCVVPLEDLNFLLSPLALSEAEYWKRCDLE